MPAQCQELDGLGPARIWDVRYEMTVEVILSMRREKSPGFWNIILFVFRKFFELPLLSCTSQE